MNITAQPRQQDFITRNHKVFSGSVKKYSQNSSTLLFFILSAITASYVISQGYLLMQ